MSAAEPRPLTVVELQRAVGDELDRMSEVIDPLGALFAAAGHAGELILRLTVPAPAGLPSVAEYGNAIGSTLHQRHRALGDPLPARLVDMAAERVRASNAIYGAAKAGLDGLAQGLGDAAAADGVRVLTIRPGFVFTKMTAGLKPAPFATTPEAVADATVRALAGRAHTVWVPSRLRWIFALLRHMPRALFRRLPL